MTNIFSYKYSTDAPSAFNGKPFLVKEVSESLLAQTLEFNIRQAQTVKKFSLPRPLRFLCPLLICAGVILFVIIIALCETASFGVTFSTFPALVILCPVCIVGGIALFIWKTLRMKKYASSEEMSELDSYADSLIRQSEAELDVPANALKIDVLAYNYKEKNGKPEKFGNYYILAENKVFTRNNCICFADVLSIVSVPLSAVKGVRLIKKRIGCLGGWNKNEPINSFRYKKHVYVSNDQIIVKSYYKIDISDVRGDFELLIPAYDFDLFSEATGFRIGYENIQ